MFMFVNYDHYIAAMKEGILQDNNYDERGYATG